MVKRPNVILVMTDDQGYADLGCTGNPWIQTSNIDAFSREAVRCEDFHVSPLCTPTRGAIMTGHRPVRNGAWATTWGRALVRRDEVMMPRIFAESGYATGMFGKWHLGDNYPYRPQDRGFQHVVAHKGGGVGQTSDFWGNNYFDDTYFHNGEPVTHEGYCTDIWFSEALKWIDAHREEPFFAYISTNAPHTPYLVAEKYRQPYEQIPEICEPAFYGMITNIDENFGQLLSHLDTWGIADQTIVIFMTDNGSSGAAELDRQGHLVRGYNAGMRGMKASYYDGGHRVPFFIRWPEGNIGGGRTVNEMALHIDLLPTFVELCGLTTPEDLTFDGESLAPLLRGETESLAEDRIQFLQYRQNTKPPEKWENAVLTRQWRLIHGSELYDIKRDPGQRHNVAAEHLHVVMRLRHAHEQWWREVSPELATYCPISLGNAAENPARLDSMDVMGDVAWHQSAIAQAQPACGSWCVDVERAGRYRFELRRWPEELDLPLNAGLSAELAEQLIYPNPGKAGVAMSPVKARLKIFDQEQFAGIRNGDRMVSMELELTETGVTTLDAWFVDKNGAECGAYYVSVTCLS